MFYYSNLKKRINLLSVFFFLEARKKVRLFYELAPFCSPWQYCAMLNQGLLEGMIGFFESLARLALGNI